MPDMDDKLAFASRLRQALKRSPKKIETATQLAVQFSLRHPNASITTQAAQKWLTGKARPTRDKVETLAQWLEVSPLWLLHGVAEPGYAKPAKARRSTVSEAAPLAEAERELLRRLRAMPEARRHLIEELVEQFSLDDEVGRP